MSLKTNLFRFIFISVLGVLLHFTYEWSGDNAVVGLFSAVNESTWEHLKLLFFPFLLLTILEVLLRGNMLPEQFLPARVLGILAVLSAETSDELQELAREIMPLMSEHENNISLNEKLFARIKAAYDFTIVGACREGCVGSVDLNGSVF